MPRLSCRFLPRRGAGLILLSLFLAAMTGWAKDAPPAGFQPGNAFYAAGKYQEAADAYEKAVAAGSYSANLFYDLGNTYYRLGQRGRAVLDYQRALLLDPGHAEARANLAFVQGRSGSDGDSWLSREIDLPEIDFWPILAACAGWLGLLGLVWNGPARWGRLAAAVVCLLVCAFAIGMTWWLDDGLKNPRRAIVLTDRSRALYSPADSSKVIANLPAGAELRVLSEQGAWVYVQLTDGTRAWLASADVEKVIPRGG
jgi:tetratricopeptide (TPR) repeat protein